MGVVVVDGETGDLLGDPEIVTRGFVYVRESEELLTEAADVLRREVLAVDPENRLGENGLRGQLKHALATFLREKTARRPMVVPMILIR